jgi:tRNA-guanine family transglycosylase
MSQQATPRSVDFSVTATAGDARAGELTVGDTTLQTPNLFPVVNFYAGGMERSVYGGGMHRTMKEFMIGAERIGGDRGYGEYFDGIMTSVASLTDYNITRERYDDYLEIPIKKREIFEPFDGTLFVDSGGFKFLHSPEIDGSDFEVEMNQETIYDIQRRMGADIIVNLDRPIAPDDTPDERVAKAEQTAEHIDEFLELSEGFDGARYLTLHGYNYSMMEEFLGTVAKTVDEQRLRESFDGIALGSLVPKKDDRGALIQAVTDCHEIMDDWGFDGLPLHVLGISSQAIPLLAALGVDTFDSSSYLHSAINGKYSRTMLETVNIDDADFSECDCPICTSELLVDRMRGNHQYQKDILGPAAMHNLIIQKRELAELRDRIHTPGTAPLVEYIENTIGRKKSIRQYAHQVVNQSLGGYF